MSHHPRRILTPGASRKRKEREAFYSMKPSPLAPPAVPMTPLQSKPSEPVSSNQLLAGYMAYEFLTKGTLFGEKWDPARAEAVPVSSASAESKRKTKVSQSIEAEPSGKVKQQHQTYAELANLLKNDGAHIPGIVNPTQLARWIQM
uniref:Embryo sac development arrest 6 n=1 Tax=Davidia involucrata TaxID=16924 RepID=A0A5B7BCC7_DAVIN